MLSQKEKYDTIHKMGKKLSYLLLQRKLYLLIMLAITIGTLTFTFSVNPVIETVLVFIIQIGLMIMGTKGLNRNIKNQKEAIREQARFYDRVEAAEAIMAEAKELDPEALKDVAGADYYITSKDEEKETL